MKVTVPKLTAFCIEALRTAGVNEDDAAITRAPLRKQLIRTGVNLGLVAVAGKQIAQRGPNLRVLVNDVNNERDGYLCRQMRGHAA